MPADFDRAIPPGGEGKITITIDTRNRKGRVSEWLKISSNDSDHSEETLTLKALIRPMIDIEPKTVNLRGKYGEIRDAEVIIRGSENRPLVLEEKYFDLDDVVQYRLEMVEGNGFYRVTIKNLPKAKGNIRGYIKFKTNYAEKPEISIYVRGRFN